MMTRILLRLVLDATLIAICLFVPARTIAWWHGWALLVVFLVVRLITVVVVNRVNPALLRERARMALPVDQPRADKGLLFAVLITGFLGLPAIAALDVFRWHLLPRPAPLVSGAGLVLFALGWGLKGVALRANAFATTVVRLQRERDHAVVDSGPYRVVRHPFYAADPLIHVGLSVWLESYFAALCAIVPIAFLVMRIRLEERFLRRELAGYDDYAARVPHRLIPGVW
jgi:protein-S-isoprenylcysteine O-methyltransferase Ste14